MAININFEGNRALVTGAGRGIGKAIAMKLRKCGAEVVAISKTEANLITLKNEEPSIETVVMDVSDWDSTAEKVKSLGTFDFLVNNAGLLQVEPLGNVSSQSFDSLYDVNIKAAFNISQIVANGMKESGKAGAIVNISSVVGTVGCPGLSVYSSTKGALNQLTKVMAIEYGPHKIRVNAVSPGVIDTDMTQQFDLTNPANPTVRTILERTPLGRFGETKDVVDPVLFLLSDMACWITGVILPVDGGYTAW